MRQTTKITAAVDELPTQHSAENAQKGKKRKRKGGKGGVQADSDKVTLPTAPMNVEPEKAKPAAQRPRGRETGHGTKTHMANAVYEEHRDRILDIIYALEHDATVETNCPCQHRNSGDREATNHRQRLWRCIDCADYSSSCSDCLKLRHVQAPFHRVQRWNGRFFERASLGDAGLEVHLGHNGEECPGIDKSRVIDMNIADVTGIHSLKFNVCTCRGVGEDIVPTHEQLLSARLFPATFSNLRTAYTFRLMEHWHLDILQGKKPVYDYWISLQRRTKESGKDLGGYKSFMRAGRYWRDLTSRRQSGQGQGIDEFLPANRYPGSVAVICPLCPEPEFNLEADWRERVKDQNESFKYTKILCIDAQYKTYSKKKRNDDKDRPLNPGCGYMSPFDETLAYEAKWVTESEETGGTCPGVDAMHRVAGGRSTTISGDAGVVCRHELFCPRGMVNLRKGEKFVLLDLAYRNALGPAPDIEIPVIFSSDRACQYSIKVVGRWAAQFPEDEAHRTILKKAKWAVPKLHIHGHKEDCQYSLHFAYIPGAGNTCGEGVERKWPEINAAGMISKDANIGHREDILSDTQRDGDHKKAIGMAAALTKKAKDSAAQVARTKAELDEFAVTIESETIRRWEAAWPEETGVRDAKGHVKSRYRVDKKKVPGREELLSMIADEEKKRGGAWAGGRGPTALLKRLIELEGEQEKLRRRVKKASDNDSTARSSIDKARVSLRVQIKIIRRLQKVHMPEIAEMLCAEEESSENVDEDDRPEDDTLYLPSSFPKEDREKFGLQRLADTELKIRRLCAESELELFKVAIRVYLIDLKKKKQNIQGVVANTRAQARLKKDMARRDKHMERYNVHYKAMLCLGYDPSDRGYQLVVKDTLESIKDVRLPADLGTGRISDHWFWREGKDVAKIKTASEKELAAMNEEELRVRYFRLWAQWKRWDEEWMLVGVELERTARHFAKMEEVWIKVAGLAAAAGVAARSAVEQECARLEARGKERCAENHPREKERRVREADGKRAYAYKKAAFYAGLKEEALSKRQIAGAWDNGRGWDRWTAAPVEVNNDRDVGERPSKKRRVAE